MMNELVKNFWIKYDNEDEWKTSKNFTQQNWILNYI